MSGSTQELISVQLRRAVRSLLEQFGDRIRRGEGVEIEARLGRMQAGTRKFDAGVERGYFNSMREALSGSAPMYGFAVEQRETLDVLVGEKHARVTCEREGDDWRPVRAESKRVLARHTMVCSEAGAYSLRVSAAAEESLDEASAQRALALTQQALKETRDYVAAAKAYASTSSIRVTERVLLEPHGCYDASLAATDPLLQYVGRHQGYLALEIANAIPWRLAMPGEVPQIVGAPAHLHSLAHRGSLETLVSMAGSVQLPGAPAPHHFPACRYTARIPLKYIHQDARLSRPPPRPRHPPDMLFRLKRRCSFVGETRRVDLTTTAEAPTLLDLYAQAFTFEAEYEVVRPPLHPDDAAQEVVADVAALLYGQPALAE